MVVCVFRRKAVILVSIWSNMHEKGFRIVIRISGLGAAIVYYRSKPSDGACILILYSDYGGKEKTSRNIETFPRTLLIIRLYFVLFAVSITVSYNIWIARSVRAFGSFEVITAGRAFRIVNDSTIRETNLSIL